MDVTEEEMYKARIEMMQARIKDLETENYHYLELLNNAENEIKALEARLQSKH